MLDLQFLMEKLSYKLCNLLLRLVRKNKYIYVVIFPTKCMFSNSRQVNQSNSLQVIYEEIENWLTCNIKAVSIESITDNRQLMNSYRECNFISPLDFVGGRINNCISEITQSCRKSPIKIIKFVRLRVKHCSVLLDKYPNMKLLHLVRDPRGIFNSRFTLGSNRNWFNLMSQQHCTEVADDLLSSFKLYQRNPRKVRIVSFEDIAETPEKTTRRLFNFTGLNITKDILAYITNQTNATFDSGFFDLSRHNSNVTVNKWRLSLDIRTANQVYNTCRQSNELLGYLQLSTLALLRNISVPSRDPSYHNKEIFI